MKASFCFFPLSYLALKFDLIHFLAYLELGLRWEKWEIEEQNQFMSTFILKLMVLATGIAFAGKIFVKLLSWGDSGLRLLSHLRP